MFSTFLQGSSVGRIYPEEKAKNNPEAILKDLNWIQRGRELALGPEKKALFEAQLKRDTELLQRLGIMDYSLLTGIHNVHRGNVDNLRDGMLTVFQVSYLFLFLYLPEQVLTCVHLYLARPRQDTAEEDDSSHAGRRRLCSAESSSTIRSSGAVGSEQTPRT